MRTRLVLMTAAALVIVLPVLPAGAGTALCSFDAGTGVVTVAPPAIAPPHVIERAGDSITVNGDPCGGATVTTVETIEVVDADAIPVVVSLGGGPFAPGKTDEGDGSSEIEFDFVGYSPDVTFAGSTGDEHLTAGGFPDDGDLVLNLNAAEAPEDIDVTFETPPPDLIIDLDGGNDTYSEMGIGEIAGPLWAAGLTVRGGEGDDVMKLAYGFARTYGGGSGSDTLSFSGLESTCLLIVRSGEGSIGGAPCPGGSFAFGGFERFMGHAGVDWLGGDGGVDQIFTRGGDDVLYASDGRDVLDGGPGDDLGDWSGTGRVRVDLRDGVARVAGSWTQVIHAIEDLVGSPKNDGLAGNARGNEIHGAGGEDTLSGRSGIDELWGDDGDDTCDPGPPGDGETTFCEALAGDRRPAHR